MSGSATPRRGSWRRVGSPALAVLACVAVALAASPGAVKGRTLLYAQQTPESSPAVAPSPSPAPAAEPGVLEAWTAAGAIRVDGRLDEAEWAAAPVASGFRQQEPDEGSPATFSTEVRVLVGRDHLYVGARLEDPEPGRLIARILERDLLLDNSGFFSLTSTDDAFLVVLDTYDDNRNGFLFATNPNGAETDAQLRDEGSLNVSWDAVWNVVSRVDDHGWTAEIAIPFRALHFAEGGSRWGVNFERVIKRRNEVALWRGWTRDNGGLLKVSQAGSLTGLGTLEQGLNLQVKPFILAEGKRADPDAPGGLRDDGASADAGLDAKLALTGNLTLDATVNTDFAQVEADVRQINLTRFNLFFPEKREFFLEGAGIFDVGDRGFNGPPPALLFFSRRIGLHGEEEVPILAGVKLTGREGPYTVGALDVVTERSVTPATNFGVARLVRDVGTRSRVGAILTHRAEEGNPGSAAGGADTHIQISQTMSFDGFAAASGEVTKSSGAYRAALDFTADQWGWFVEQAYYGEAFDPAIGFVLRNDINRQFGTFRVTPRPDILGLRRVDLRLNGTFVSSGEWDPRDRQLRFSVTPQFDSGDQIEIGVQHDFVRLTEPFTPGPDVLFPTADYDNQSLTLDVQSSRNRFLSGELYVNDLGYFSGRNWNLGGTLRVAASRNLSFETNWDHNAIRTPDGDLTTDLANLRVNWAFSTRLFTSALLQYDSFADALEANLRLDFIHSPGSDLFVVLNERRGHPGDLLRSRDRALVVKLTKQLDF